MQAFNSKMHPSGSFPPKTYGLQKQLNRITKESKVGFPCLVRGKFICSGKHGLEILKGRFLKVFQFHIKNKNLILEEVVLASFNLMIRRI